MFTLGIFYFLIIFRNIHISVISNAPFANLRICPPSNPVGTRKFLFPFCVNYSLRLKFSLWKFHNFCLLIKKFNALELPFFGRVENLHDDISQSNTTQKPNNPVGYSYVLNYGKLILHQYVKNYIF